MTSKRSRLASGAASVQDLRDRAAATKASAKRVIRKDLVDQPSQESLPERSPVDRPDQTFRSSDESAHGRPRRLHGQSDRDDAANRWQPEGESDMGRHETFANAVPLSAKLAPATSLSGVERVVARPRPLDADAPLSEACHWAVSQVGWINSGISSEEHWDDDRMRAEMDKAEQVVIRAISEPSPDLETLTAKARIVLQELENDGEPNGDNRERLTFTILRELIEQGSRKAEKLAPSARSTRLDLSPEFLELSCRVDDVARLASIVCTVKDDLLRQKAEWLKYNGYKALLLTDEHVRDFDWITSELSRAAASASDSADKLETLLAEQDIRVRGLKARSA